MCHIGTVEKNTWALPMCINIVGIVFPTPCQKTEHLRAACYWQPMPPSFWHFYFLPVFSTGQYPRSSNFSDHVLIMHSRNMGLDPSDFLSQKKSF